MDQFPNQAVATKIGNKSFVGGLFWQSLTRPRELKKEAAEQAKKNNFDLYLIRQGVGVAQTGLAQTDEGFSAGMVSLAAVVAKRIADEGLTIDGVPTRAHNWIGALELPDGRWVFLAVRDDAIMPSGDFVGTRAEVMERLDQTYGLGSWTAVVGTPDVQQIGFHHFVAKQLEDLLKLDKRGNPKVAADMSLRPFKLSLSPKLILLAVVGVLLTVGASAGVMYWQRQKEMREQEAVMEAARQQDLAQQRLATVNAVIPHPWAAAPLASDMAAACESGIELKTPAGWKVGGVVCTNSGIIYSLERGTSTVGQLREAEATAQIDQTGDKATVSRGVIYRVMRDESLGKAAELTEQLLDINQRLGIKMTSAFVPLPEPKKALPGENVMRTAEPPKPDWQTHTLVIGPTGLSPALLVTYLDVPGFRFDKITFTEGEWTYEGSLYAR